MIPSNSSNMTNGCDSISSNCVIWQGPDISCIDLCNGDTISEVTYKLATEVCDLITSGVTANPNLDGLDLTCLNIPGTTPTTLVPVLQEMVNSICADSGSNLPPENYVQDNLPIMTLPLCLQYNDAGGNLVTQLRLDLFATLIANKVCDILTTISSIQSTLTSYGDRIAILEACVLPCSGVVVEKQIVPTCILPSVLTDVSVLVLAIEARFCALENAVGLPAAINSAISQTVIVSSYTTLTNNAVTYGSITGWNAGASTLAESFQNAWVVIDDMYTAIQNIQLNCCPSGCDAVTFGFIANGVTNPSGEIDTINFDFTSSSIPAAFNDCAGSTVVTITDASSTSITSTVNVSSLQSNPSGINVSTAALNTSQDLSISVAFCVTNGSDTCSDVAAGTVPGIVPCPAIINVTGVTTEDATVEFANLIGVTATYVIDILDGSGVIVDTYTQNNPGVTVTNTFTGLTPGTTYTARVTVEKGGATKVCTNTTSFTTNFAFIACDQGMDVAILFDYCDANLMQPIVADFKTNASSIATQIATLSGVNDYRIGLGITDQGAGITPSYNASVEYTALPVGQKSAAPFPGAPSLYAYLTTVEVFQTNNGATFDTQLNKLDTVDWPLGTGAAGTQPTGALLSVAISGSLSIGTLRPSASKVAVVITDELPSSGNGVFDATSVAELAALQQQCLIDGIKVIVLGNGAARTYTDAGGTTTTPWADFAVATGGTFDITSNAASLNNALTTICT
jgi:hypothetical protein